MRRFESQRAPSPPKLAPPAKDTPREQKRTHSSSHTLPLLWAPTGANPLKFAPRTHTRRGGGQIEFRAWWHARASFPIALYYRYGLSPDIFHVSHGIALYQPRPKFRYRELCWKHAASIATQAAITSRSYRTIGGIAAILSQIAVWNCENFCPLQGSFWALRAQSGKKSPKRVPRASRPWGAQESKTEPKKSQNSQFWLV